MNLHLEHLLHEHRDLSAEYGRAAKDMQQRMEEILAIEAKIIALIEAHNETRGPPA